MRISDWSSDVCSSDLPPGSSIERTEAIVKKVGTIGLEQRGIEHAVQFPGLSINGFTRSSDAAIVFFPLKNFDERPGLRGPQIAAELNKKTGAIDGAMVIRSEERRVG